ncbi:kinase-like protein [Gigaspora margarita]|uniref:Kinase-like protein n=1 Tax=Gigaspora margarita TaxID=4874 RepID=A0A8H4AIS9_GIGMA|nr:kinase-like protein [Gigaspora margarita]
MATDETSTILSNTSRDIITITNAIDIVVDAIKHLVYEICNICYNAECNKEICFRMKIRVEMAKCDVEKIERNLDTKKDFRDKSYYLAFEKFKKILLKVKDFTKSVSTIRDFKRFINVNDVKNVKVRYGNLTKEFDECMHDLQFFVVVDSEEEIQKVDKELKEVSHLLNKIGNHYDMLLTLEIKTVKNKQVIDAYEIEEIAERDLIDPIIQEEKYINCNVIKKIYRPLGIDVACKKAVHYMEGFTFLSKLSQLPHILRFYGLSTINKSQFMVFEWADYGDLKELYDKFVIPWHRKIQIINDICRGISFLRTVNILHHDIKCANIFVLRDLSIKIGFKSSHYSDEKAEKFIPWLAPEIMEGYKYNFECEMFSFGMLIWELCYERVPYEGWDVPRIKDHVLKAWLHVPNLRISIAELSYKLDELAEKYPLPHDMPLLLQNKELELKIENQINQVITESLLPIFVDDPEEIIEENDIILSLEDGYKLHRIKKHEDAWKCFIQNSELPSAKYWQGYYYYNGYFVEKDLDKARNLFKEAADENHTEAQIRYAAMLFPKKDDDESAKDKNTQEIIHYLKLAAENKTIDAMYYLGDIYLNGKLKVPKDKERGLSYLKLAAKSNNKRALETLEKLGIKI